MEILQYSKIVFGQTLLQRLKSEIFIYPTDTIYGLGCNALDEELVERLRELKQRPTKPFSLLVPSLDWIREHCILLGEAEEWLAKLPGPYTFILQLKDTRSFAQGVCGGMTVGVRIPRHPFSRIVEKLGIPLVTTSVNLSGEKPMIDLDTLSPGIKKGVDFIIYESKKDASPSQIIDLVGGKARVIQRN